MDLGELTLKLGADWGDALSQLGTLKDALSGAFAPPDVSAVLGAFDQVSQAVNASVTSAPAASTNALTVISDIENGKKINTATASVTISAHMLMVSSEWREAIADWYGGMVNVIEAIR